MVTIIALIKHIKFSNSYINSKHYDLHGIRLYNVTNTFRVMLIA